MSATLSSAALAIIRRMQYVGSMVLGLNDALVELTGSLAGFIDLLKSPIKQRERVQIRTRSFYSFTASQRTT